MSSAEVRCDATSSPCERRPFARALSLADAVAIAREVELGREWSAEMRDDVLLFRTTGMSWAEMWAFKDAIEQRLPDGLKVDVSSQVWP
jgi:hypothetical protein